MRIKAQGLRFRSAGQHHAHAGLPSRLKEAGPNFGYLYLFDIYNYLDFLKLDIYNYLFECIWIIIYLNVFGLFELCIWMYLDYFEFIYLNVFGLFELFELFGLEIYWG